MHTANTLTYFQFLFFKKKKTNIWSFFFKMCFNINFLNTKKILFLHSGFYNMFVKLQKVLSNILKKYKNLIFLENSSIIHR